LALKERENFLENKLVCFQAENRTVHLLDHKDYEDRVRGLLAEME
jgi:hypothetical protein